MIGKNPLWVSKQHGHSLVTMLRIYAAWTDGAVEAYVQTIERSMEGPEEMCWAVSKVRIRLLTACSTAKIGFGKLAGVAGFEPMYGGIKTRDTYQHNQQVADLADLLVPRLLSFPRAAPELPPGSVTSRAGREEEQRIIPDPKARSYAPLTLPKARTVAETRLLARARRPGTARG
jgi:hypothetical protein